MKTFANSEKEAARAHAKAVYDKLPEAVQAQVSALGPVLLDATKPEGEYVAEFDFAGDVKSLSKADKKILADVRVIEVEAETPADVIQPPTETAPSDAAAGQQPAEAPPVDAQPPQPENAAPVAPVTTRDVEVESFDGRKVTAQIPVGAGRKRLAVRNEVAQPAEATMARMVWDKADAISKEKGRPALGVETRNALADSGIPASTVSTEFRKWAKFWDVTEERLKEIEAAMTDDEKAALKVAAGEEARLKAEMRALEKNAKALERAAVAEEKKQAREELKAAKRRSAEEAAELKRKQNSEEAKKKLEERLAKNAAVARERAQNAAKAAEEKAAERAKVLDKLRAEVAERNAAAQARIEALRNGSGAAGNASTGEGETPAVNAPTAQPESGNADQA